MTGEAELNVSLNSTLYLTGNLARARALLCPRCAAVPTSGRPPVAVAQHQRTERACRATRSAEGRRAGGIDQIGAQGAHDTTARVVEHLVDRREAREVVERVTVGGISWMSPRSNASSASAGVSHSWPTVSVPSATPSCPGGMRPTRNRVSKRFGLTLGVIQRAK